MSSFGRAGDWHPLLVGQRRAQAMSVVQLVADSLTESTEACKEDSAAGGRSQKVQGDPSLAMGSCGQALFFAELAREKDVAFNQAASMRLLNESIGALEATQSRASLFAGFTGVAWVAECIRKGMPVERREDDPNDEVDRALEQHAALSPWRREYDLVYGLVGFGVYALERLPNARAVRCLELIVDRLAEVAQEDHDGITWYTSPSLLSPHQREQFPLGHYNLGVAHGVPAVIPFLSAVHSFGVAVEKSRSLLDGAVTWLLRQRLPASASSCFSYWVGPDIRPEVSRLAWCYGDPGIATTLFCAARQVHEKAWEDEAMDIAKKAALRSPDESGVQDAGLCHGSAGLAHIFNRLYQATGNDLFEQAARFWLDCTLRSWRIEEGRQQQGGEDAGFLTGSVGTAMVLLAAATSNEPVWDRVLLLSIPHRAKGGGQT